VEHLLQLATALLVLLQRFVGEGLEDLDGLTTVLAGVFVGWHQLWVDR
jgi:hypothetical protein